MLFLVHVLALMLDEIMHDIMKGLAQEFPARQNLVDRLAQTGSSAWFQFDARLPTSPTRLAAAGSRIFSFSKTMSSFG